MGKAKLTDEPIVAMLRGSNRDGVAVVTKRHGVSEQAIYGWRNKFGAFQANDVRRLKQLENENAQLRKLMAERGLEIEVIKKINAKNGRRADSSISSSACNASRDFPMASLHADDGQSFCPWLLHEAHGAV